MIGLEERELPVGVDAAGAEQAPLGGHERQVVPGCARAARRELGLAERDDVLGERESLDDAPQAPDRWPERTPGRLDARQPRVGGREAGLCAERRAIGRAGRREAPAVALERTEQHLNVGGALGRRAPGVDREAHRGDRPADVAAQLAQVGHAGVGREAGLDVDEPLKHAAGLVVAPQLDERVDDHRQRPRRLRRERAGAPAGDRARPEVVATQGERSLADRRRDVAAVAGERLAVGLLRPGVVRVVAGLADLLQVRVAERAQLIPAPHVRAQVACSAAIRASVLAPGSTATTCPGGAPAALGPNAR